MSRGKTHDRYAIATELRGEAVNGGVAIRTIIILCDCSYTRVYPPSGNITILNYLQADVYLHIYTHLWPWRIII